VSAHGTVLLRGGSVYSTAAPFATAMLTVDGQVAWVGEDEAASGYTAEADQVVDLAGKLVTPGFVDAHVHLAQTGFALQTLDLSGTSSLTEALDALSQAARRHAGGLLLAHGWDETSWPEGRPISGAELDRAVGNTVAYVSRIDGHSGVVSTALVRRTPAITEADGWRGDGTVERDAHHIARTVTHQLTSAADRTRALRLALRRAASVGITSVHELNAPHIAPFDDLRLLEGLAAEGRFPDVVPYWGGLMGAGASDDVRLQGLAGDLNADGAIGSRTACMHDPYADAATAGHLYLDADQVCEHVVHCTRLGLQAGFHVIGDKAMDEVATGLRKAAEQVGREALVQARHRLEHVEMPDQDVIETLAACGVVASVQPMFDALWGAPGELYERRLGWQRARPMNPIGSLQRAGVVLAFGSDSPVTPLGPWAAVQAATRHHEEAERLTVRAAFNAHTRGGHRARRDDSGGVLAPGADATYVVWDVPGELTVQTPDDRVAGWSTDPRAGVPVLPDLDPGSPLPTCVRTVVRGTTVYNAESPEEG
jgi:predicted amidohydrolase YtcJ